MTGAKAVVAEVDCARVVEQLNALGQSITYAAAAQPPIAAVPELLVLGEAELGDTSAPCHHSFLTGLAERGFGDNRRLVSASVALRLGWSSGLEIGAYVALGLLADVRQSSIIVERGLVRQVLVHEASFRAASELPEDERRRWLAYALYRKVERFVAAHHAWSRFSRRALFSMLESGWAGQFTGFGEATGQADWAAAEALAVLAAHPVLARDAPALYSLEAEGRRKTCQRRTLCCLYYKMPGADYCSSCPILGEQERRVRQLRYVAQYGAAI